MKVSRFIHILLVLSLSLAIIGCGSEEESGQSADAIGADVTQDQGASADASEDLVAIEDGAQAEDMMTEDLVSVQDSTAPKVEPAALPIYSAGTCPELSAGNAVDELTMHWWP